MKSYESSSVKRKRSTKDETAAFELWIYNERESLSIFIDMFQENEVRMSINPTTAEAPRLERAEGISDECPSCFSTTCHHVASWDGTVCDDCGNVPGWCECAFKRRLFE